MTLTKPIYWMISIPALLIAVISWRVFVMPMSLVMPDMAAYAMSVPVGVWGHVIFAPIALALVPLQLSTKLRAKRPALHRWAGRVYGVAVLLSALASLMLLPGSIASTFARAGFATLAVLWIAFTGLGIMAARQRDFSGHRRWMVRSIALTFAAVTLRFIMAPLMANGWTVAETYEVTAWGSWVINLVVVEYAMRRRGALARAQA